MKETKENIQLLKRLGFKLDQHGYYTNERGWGFRLEYMPSFKVLLSRIHNSAYEQGVEHTLEKMRGNKFINH